MDPLFYMKLYLIKNVLVEKDIKLFMFHKFLYVIECTPKKRYAFQINSLDSVYTLYEDGQIPLTLTFPKILDWTRNLTKD